MSSFIEKTDNFVFGLALIGCKTTLFIIIALVGIVRCCFGLDDVDIDDSYMKNRHQFQREFVTDSTGNGFECVWFTTEQVTDERYKEISNRYHLRRSYQALRDSAAVYFNHNLIETDIYDFAEWAKGFDLAPDTVRLVNVFVTGIEYPALYRRAHPDYPDGVDYLDNIRDIGDLYINENDIYPYNSDAKRNYRYWKCEAKTDTDERHTHITKRDRDKLGSYFD